MWGKPCSIASALLLVTVVAMGCGGEDEVILEAIPGVIDRSCSRGSSDGTLPQEFQIQSIRVEAIEWESGTPGPPIASECSDNIRDFYIRHPRQLIDWYTDQGYLVRGIPADVPTRVQIIGFLNNDCTIEWRPLGPLVCGLTEGVLTEDTYSSGDPLRFTFACVADPRDPADTGLFGMCVSVGSLPEESE